MLMFIIFVAVQLVFIELFVAHVLYRVKYKKSYYRMVGDGGGFLFKYDPVIGYVHKPNIRYKRPTTSIENAPRRILFKDIRIGNEGFLFTENVNELKERYKLIFCIGGSTTAGNEASYDKTYPAVLDSLVMKNGYRCINAGLGGCRSIHDLLFFKHRVLPYKPTSVIICSGMNDFEDAAYGFSEPYNQFKHCHSHSLPTNKLEAIMSHSAAFHLTKSILYRISGRIRSETKVKTSNERTREVLKKSEWLNEWYDNIGKIIDICKEHKIKCYLLCAPLPVYENAPKEAREFANKDLNMHDRFDIFLDYQRLIRTSHQKLSKEKDIGLFDLTSVLDGYCLDEKGRVDYKRRFSFFIDREHLTEETNAIIANSIYEEIRKEL